MNLIERLKRFAFGAPESQPGRRGSRGGGVRSQESTTTNGSARSGALFFEAARQSPDRTPIPYTSVALRRALGQLWSESAERELVAGIARWIVDNYPMAFYGIDLVANYSAPVIPRAASFDPNWNTDAELLFDEWALTCDFSRRFDFETLQRLASFAIDIDGDVAFSMPLVDGVPSLRSWPCWRLGSPLSRRSATAPDGVVLDAEDRVVGFDVLVGKERMETFGVNQMILLADADRFERLRGVSALRRGLNDLRDAHDIKAFLKLGTKIESALAAVIEGDGGMESDWDADLPGTTTADDEAADGEEGDEEKEQKSSVSIANLLGGDIPVIHGKLSQLESKQPGTNKVDFMDSLAGYFVAGIGLPPAFFLDVKLTGPNQRAVIGKAQRRFNRRKAVLSRLARWVWIRHTAWRIENGELPAVEGWQRVTFQFPPIATIDLGDQLAAEHEALARGYMTRQIYHGNGGRDWQDVEDQGFAEDDYILPLAKAQAEKHGVPIELILARHGFAEPKAKPQEKAPGQGDDDEEETRPARNGKTAPKRK